jgi:acetate---CoA ligase (ADP-forming)
MDATLAVLAQRRANLHRLVAPKSLAFIGGARAADGIRNARAAGFAGRIYAVNPRQTELEGVRCIASVADLPEPPDASFLATPIEASIQSVRALSAMGAGAAVCYAAGFAETGERGNRLQAELVQAAGGMALVGPNCFGVINYVNGGSLWPTPYSADTPGRSVAMLAQSGNLCINLSQSQRSVPWRYIISVRNQAALGIEDYIAHFADETEVRAIGVFLEGLRDVPAFHEAALHAAESGIPIVVVKSGLSKAGARLALSHTSSIAGTDEMYDALFARTGVIRVRSIPEMQEQLKLLAMWGAKPGRRLVVFSTSGGDSGMAADFADAADLVLPEPDAAAAAAVKAVLPDYGAVSNPLDFTAVMWGQQEPLTRVFTTLMAGAVDKAVLVLDGPRQAPLAGTAVEKTADALIAACDATGLPAASASVMPETVLPEYRTKMIAAGIAPLQGVHDAFRVIAAAARYAEWRGRLLAGQRPLPLLHARSLPSRPVTVLDEHVAKSMLARCGLRVPQGQVASLNEVPVAAWALGFPLVVKALHPGIGHKTEVGGVELNIADVDAAETAARRIRDSVAARNSEIVVEQFLVERMIGHAVAELIVGIKRDPQFGLCLLMGAGSILTELLRFSVLLLLPVQRREVAAVLRDGALGPLLGGFRGAPPGDVNAAVDAVMAVTAFAELHRDSLLEMDVNPLLVLPVGEGAVAVDVLVGVSECQDPRLRTFGRTLPPGS